jgi:hypothetical protein
MPLPSLTNEPIVLWFGHRHDVKEDLLEPFSGEYQREKKATEDPLLKFALFQRLTDSGV